MPEDNEIIYLRISMTEYVYQGFHIQQNRLSNTKGI